MSTFDRHHALDPDAHEAPAKRDWPARCAPLVNLVFVLAFAWLSGAILHPSHQILRWALLATVTAYLATATAYLTWTTTNYIHTRRNR